MKNEPLYSVVIPRHRESDLRRLLEPLSGDPLVGEVLVVEDEPVADIDPVSRAMISANEKIRVLPSAETRGPGAARNVGISQSRYPYLVFLDADDEFDEVYFTRAAELIRGHETVDVFKFGHFVVGDSITRYEVSAPYPQMWGVEIDGARLVLPAGEKTLVDSAYAWSSIYRSDFVRRNGVRFCETFSAEDYYFLWALLLSGPKVMISGESFYVYRRGGGITSALDERNMTFVESFRQILSIGDVRSNIGYFGKAVRQLLAMTVGHVEKARRLENEALETQLIARTRVVLDELDHRWVAMVLRGLPRTKSNVRAVVAAHGFFEYFRSSTYFEATTGEPRLEIE